MKLSLNKAAQHYKISKSTLSEALNTGRISATKDARGRWEIDPSEMDRVFPLNSEKPSQDRNPNPEQNTQTNAETLIEIARLRAELDAEKRLSSSMADQVEDLRSRLDKSDEERRGLTAALTDQRPKERGGVFSNLFGKRA